MINIDPSNGNRISLNSNFIVSVILCKIYNKIYNKMVSINNHFSSLFTNNIVDVNNEDIVLKEVVSKDLVFLLNNLTNILKSFILRLFK